MLKYLIKLESRSNGREAFVEYPASIIIEELIYKIKVELHLPYTDFGMHAFQMHRKVYVPSWQTVSSLWRIDDFATEVEYI